MAHSTGHIAGGRGVLSSQFPVPSRWDRGRTSYLVLRTVVEAPSADSWNSRHLF